MGRAWGAICITAALLLASAGCSSNDDADGATLDTAPTTDRTTTTLSAEEEVEQAYLKSWEVYTEAVRTFDTSRLEEAFSGPALEIVLGDVEKLRKANTPARMEIDHDYKIELANEIAQLTDNYVNHSVLLDGESGEPIEDDPNDRLAYLYLLQRIEGQWKVVDISRR